MRVVAALNLCHFGKFLTFTLTFTHLSALLMMLFDDKNLRVRRARRRFPCETRVGSETGAEWEAKKMKV
jgi:hypothetical protein